MAARKLKSTKKGKRYDRKQTKTVEVVEVLTPSQLRKIESIENSRDQAICKLLLHTGLRVEELTLLNYSDVFESIKENKVKDVVYITGKGNKERMIPFNQDARNAILAIHHYNKKVLNVRVNINAPLLISLQLKRMSKSNIQKMIRAELDTHPHVFRHTCFTNIRKQGVPLEVIQKLAGHSSITTTTKYYLDVNTDDLKDAIQKIQTPLEAIISNIESSMTFNEGLAYAAK